MLGRLWTLLGKKRRDLVRARRAELEGDLASAVTLFAEGGRPDEAARVLVLRGDAEIDPGKRRQHYAQAVSLVAPLPPDHPAARLVRRKRALLAVAAAEGGATSAAARQDLLEAAADLEAIGEAARAAEAYALAGDVEGEARALVDAGDVERVEEVLERDRARESDAQKARAARAEIEDALASGRRREALARAEAAAREAGDEASRERAQAIRARRALAPRVALELRGERIELLLGEEVAVGRSDDATGAVLGIASHAVSRRHLLIARGEEGRPVLRDLGSRNGTELRGMRVAGALAIPDEGIEVRLGGEVPLRAAPSEALRGAVTIEVGGARVTAPLGPARLGIGGWRIEAGADGWLELATDAGSPAFLGDVQLEARTPLLRGDAIAARRGGEVLLRVAG